MSRPVPLPNQAVWCDLYFLHPTIHVTVQKYLRVQLLVVTKLYFGPEGPTLNDLADSALRMRRLIASVRWHINGPPVKWHQFSSEL